MYLIRRNKERALAGPFFLTGARDQLLVCLMVVLLFEPPLMVTFDVVFEPPLTVAFWLVRLPLAPCLLSESASALEATSRVACALAPDVADAAWAQTLPGQCWSMGTLFAALFFCVA